MFIYGIFGILVILGDFYIYCFIKIRIKIIFKNGIILKFFI